MGDLDDNLYRQRIRGKYHANKNLHFILKMILLIIIVALACYFIVQYDVINKIKNRNQRTLEEITNFSFEDINYVTTNLGSENIDKQIFIDKFKNTKYRMNTEPEKLAENGKITYYVYKENGRQAYELYDLGDGYIKIIQNGEIPAVYEEVK